MSLCAAPVCPCGENHVCLPSRCCLGTAGSWSRKWGRASSHFCFAAEQHFSNGAWGTGWYADWCTSTGAFTALFAETKWNIISDTPVCIYVWPEGCSLQLWGLRGILSEIIPHLLFTSQAQRPHGHCTLSLAHGDDDCQKKRSAGWSKLVLLDFFPD